MPALIDWNPSFCLEFLSAAAALIGATISGRFTYSSHRTLRNMLADKVVFGIVFAKTKRRTNATLFFVQLTLIVACVYRIHPFLGWAVVPAAMRLAMSLAVIRCCWLNARDRRELA